MIFNFEDADVGFIMADSSEQQSTTKPYQPQIKITTSNDHVLVHSPKAGGNRDSPVNCTDLISQVFLIEGYEAATAKLASKYPAKRKVLTAAGNQKPKSPPAHFIDNLFI